MFIKFFVFVDKFKVKNIILVGLGFIDDIKVSMSIGLVVNVNGIKIFDVNFVKNFGFVDIDNVEGFLDGIIF